MQHFHTIFKRRYHLISSNIATTMVRGLVPSMSDMVRGLVPSMSNMSAEQFWYDCRIGSYMIRYKGYFHSWNGGAWSVTRNTWSRTEGHSDMTVGCVPTWSDVSAWPFWCDWGMCSHLIKYTRLMPFSWRMEAPGKLPGTLNLGLRAFPSWLRDVFPHGWM